MTSGVKFVRVQRRSRAVRRRGGEARLWLRGRGPARIISSEPWSARRAAPSDGRRCAARTERMLRLHYFSDNPALVRADDEDSVYSIELIKEFETVGRAWKAFLADWLLQGPLVCVTRLHLVGVLFCFVVGVYAVQFQ